VRMDLLVPCHGEPHRDHSSGGNVPYRDMEGLHWRGRLLSKSIIDPSQRTTSEVHCAEGGASQPLQEPPSLARAGGDPQKGLYGRLPLLRDVLRRLLVAEQGSVSRGWGTSVEWCGVRDIRDSVTASGPTTGQ
jgi:hypothetical protein